jgi:hypothetical protein
MNPNTGRFWTPDSFEGFQTDPLSLHKYLYAHGNPVNRIDPSGKYSTAEQANVSGIQGVMARVILPAVARAPRTVYTVAQWNRAVSGFQAGVRGSTAFKAGAVGVLATTIAGNVAMVVEALDEPDDTETIFYTVQGPDDAARLRGTGEPWPSDAFRASLGPGVYAWRHLGEAEDYRRRLHYPDLLILMFGIRNRDLNSFSRFDVDSAPDPDQWMNRYSLLWGGIPDHGYRYITRRTDIGIEHYFHKSVLPFLHFR